MIEYTHPLLALLQEKTARIPQHPYLVHQGQAISCAELLRLVRNTANALRVAGLQPGQRVLLRVDNPVMHLVTMLAIWHEAAVSVSPGRELSLPFAIQWQIRDTQDQFHEPFEQDIFIDRPWLEAMHAQQANISPRSYPEADATCRIELSSGTTGDPKGIALGLTALHQRCAMRHDLYPLAGGVLSTMGITTAPGLHVTMMPLFGDNTVYLGTVIESAHKYLADYPITYLSASPAQLMVICAQFEACARRPKQLRAVIAGGAALHPSLIRRIRHTLCDVIFSQYSSTETSIIALASGDELLHGIPGTGRLLPGSEVEIIDDRGYSVPQGEEGLIRIRTPYMARGYVDIEDTSLHDGWFLSNDCGYLRRDGSLVVSGRANEVINLGGHKFHPKVLDDYLMMQKGVVDALSVALETPHGQTKVCCVVVPGEGFEMSRLRKAMEQDIKPNIRPHWIVEMEAIARNAAGKALRHNTATQVLQRNQQALAGHRIV